MLIIVIVAAVLPAITGQALPARVGLTCVDEKAIGYATFQSHNQKVVKNRYGIFMTHLRTRNEAYTAQTWRLSRSTDGGKTFRTLFEETRATNPPVLETDSRGSVYLLLPDFSDGAAYLYRFSESTQFSKPEITRIPNGAAGKYAASIDEARGRLYYFAHNGTFHTLAISAQEGARSDSPLPAAGRGVGGEGHDDRSSPTVTLLESKQLLKDGPDAILQYPLLYVETARRGGTRPTPETAQPPRPTPERLHAAWTTQRRGVYLYWDIHHMLSDDGGATWRTMEGKPVALPAVADQHGPTTRVTLDDEFEAHTWLSSFTVSGGKVHFLYLAQTTPPRQHYVRYDLATGRRELDTQPTLKGETIRLQGLDGFFAVGRSGELYAVGNDSGRLACLVSRDNGTTWHDYARAETRLNLYSIGGCRSVTPQGEIIGSFTDQRGDNLKPDQASKVYFFRIVAGK